MEGELGGGQSAGEGGQRFTAFAGSGRWVFVGGGLSMPRKVRSSADRPSEALRSLSSARTALRASCACTSAVIEPTWRVLAPLVVYAGSGSALAQSWSGLVASATQPRLIKSCGS